MEATHKQLSLAIAKEFTDTPGPRFKVQGPHSGEEFRESILLPRFRKALAENTTLYVDLDGGYGYGTSFLEESFGGLAREYKNSDLVLRTLHFKSDEEPSLINRIKKYIAEARD